MLTKKHPRPTVGLVRVVGDDKCEIHMGAYNVGLRYLANAARAAGGQVEILDPLGPTTGDDVFHALSQDIVGFTVHHLNIHQTLHTIRSLKRERPSTFIVVGGHHAAGASAELIQEIPEIDAVCCTGGEQVISQLVAAFCASPERARLGFRGCLRGNEIDDLDALPLPEAPASGSIARMSTSRGCPFTCSFCTTPAMRELWNEPVYRTRSPASIVREFERLYESGFTEIRVNDDLFVAPSRLSRSRALQIANLLLDRGLPIKYKLEYRCDSIPLDDTSMLSTLRASGLREVFLGVESGSDRILQEYKKNLAFKTSLAAVRIHDKAGVVVNAGNILASPDSTIGDVVNSITGFTRLGLAYLLFRRTNLRAHVYPGTELERRLRAENRLVGEQRFGDLSYKFTERRVEDVVELFEGALPTFLKETRGELFIGRKAALRAVYDGDLDATRIRPILTKMNADSAAFLLRWFRDLPSRQVTSDRFTDEMEAFVAKCKRWGTELLQLGEPSSELLC